MRERIVYLAGAASRRGDGQRLLGGLLRYLGATAGIEDAAEASYRADPSGAPLPYDRGDTSAALDESVATVAAILGWHRRELGLGGQLHLLGWSLGGALLFEAAVRLVAAEPSWRGCFGGIITLSAPILGCDVDGVTALGEVAAGAAGRELCARGGDPAHRRWVEAAAADLRAGGARLVTLGAADDAIVTPRDSIVAAPGESIERYTLRPTPRLGADFGERHLGHGAILGDPVAWRMVLEAIAGQA